MDTTSSSVGETATDTGHKPEPGAVREKQSEHIMCVSGGHLPRTPVKGSC